METQHKEQLEQLIELYGIQSVMKMIESIGTLQTGQRTQDQKQIINFWKDTVKEHLGITPFINWGRNIQSIKRAQKQLTDDQIKKVIEFYMEWYTENQHTEGFKPAIDLNMALSAWMVNLFLRERGQYE